MPEKIKWGFIGCGKVVEKKSGAAFRNVPDSCIHAIMRRNLEQAEHSARQFSAPLWFNHIEDLLSSGVDAVYIATPPGLHYEQALQCCDAGKPVYIEKPFARNYTEAKAIVDAFARKKIPIYVGHYRRALPRFQKIRQLLSEGTIGKICSADFYLNRIFSKQEAEHSWLYHPALSGGGKFYDIAPHTVDIMVYLLGGMKELHGFAVNNGTDCPLEDHVAFSFATEQDIIGSAVFNCISNRKDDRMVIAGTKGTLEFSIHGRCDIIINDYSSGQTEVLEIPDPETVEEPMVQAVVDHLLQRGCCPCSGEDALPAYYAIDRILEGFYHGRQDDFWNHPERWGSNANLAIPRFPIASR